MKRSQLNLKPIILTPIEVCAFIGKAIKEYRQNNPKKKARKIIDPLNDTEDEEAGKNGSSTERCVLDITEGAGEPRRRSRLNETDTTISTEA